jgi:hypothetical protein
MTNSNDDTRNPSTSIRDQLRVYTNKIDPRSDSPRAGGFAVKPAFAFDEDWPREIKKECSQDAPCGRLTCAACSDPLRLRWIRQTLAITKAYPGQHKIATIVLLPIPPTILHAKIIRSRVLRGVFEKADFQGARLRGAIDVIWDSAHNDWILCAHVLAIDVPREAWARLRALLRNAKPKWAEPNYFDASYFRPNFLVKVQHLHDPETQISNLVKFHTYFWPREGAAGSPAPMDRLEELANWASRNTFEDFIFRFKMKRRE